MRPVAAVAASIRDLLPRLDCDTNCSYVEQFSLHDAVRGAEGAEQLVAPRVAVVARVPLVVHEVVVAAIAAQVEPRAPQPAPGVGLGRVQRVRLSLPPGCQIGVTWTMPGVIN
jgi:hypothetical protein